MVLGLLAARVFRLSGLPYEGFLNGKYEKYRNIKIILKMSRDLNFGLIRDGSLPYSATPKQSTSKVGEAQNSLYLGHSNPH